MKSHYDSSRDTVGKIYRDAQLYNDKSPLLVGDLNYELRKSLVDDLNQTIIDGTKEFDGKPFYITIHEKKDLQMPSAILRRMIKTKYRPYPEDDTVVFYVKDPKVNDVRFCWCLPHWTEMYNILANANLFDFNLVEEIRQWRRLNLHHFGFIKDEIGNWMPNPNWEDKKLVEEQPKVSLLNV